MLGGKRALLFTVGGHQSVRYSSGRLKELGIRLKSIANIEKITKTMKMISSAKYVHAARQLEPARVFGNAGNSAALALASNDKNQGTPEGKHLVVIMSSDRGLCGALHSNTGRAGMAVMDEHPDSACVCVGDKVRLFLKKGYGNKFLVTGSEIGRVNPTFADMGVVASAILHSGYEYTGGTVIYNKHKSAMTQVLSDVAISSEQGMANAAGIEAYDSVDADQLKSFAEFSLAATLFGCIKENYASEQAARMVAMEGASKNAAEMIDRMTITYNRLRQAVITTELCEIIAGMSAL